MSLTRAKLEEAVRNNVEAALRTGGNIFVYDLRSISVTAGIGGYVIVEDRLKHRYGAVGVDAWGRISHPVQWARRREKAGALGLAFLDELRVNAQLETTARKLNDVYEDVGEFGAF